MLSHLSRIVTEKISGVGEMRAIRRTLRRPGVLSIPDSKDKLEL